MTDFKVSFFTGDYKWRQLFANESRIDLYVEHHFNFYSKQTNYTLVKVAQNCKTEAFDFGKLYNSKVSSRLGVPLYDSCRSDGGILRLKANSRDVFNLSLVTAPAVIVEPLFLSNNDHVDLLLNKGGVQTLADILTDSLREFFEDRESVHIGFSVGHKYQRTSPSDRGSVCLGKSEMTEADLSDTILTITKTQLENNLPTIYPSDSWLKTEPVFD